MMVGLMWHWSFPINKSLWTSSYVLFSGGMACRVARDRHVARRRARVSGWTKPFVVYGVNPMLAFLGSGLMARIDLLDPPRDVRRQARAPVQKAIYRHAVRVVAPAAQRVARVRARVRRVLAPRAPLAQQSRTSCSRSDAARPRPLVRRPVASAERAAAPPRGRRRPAAAFVLLAALGLGAAGGAIACPPRPRFAPRTLPHRRRRACRRHPGTGGTRRCAAAAAQAHHDQEEAARRRGAPRPRAVRPAAVRPSPLPRPPRWTSPRSAARADGRSRHHALAPRGRHVGRHGRVAHARRHAVRARGRRRRCCPPRR